MNIGDVNIQSNAARDVAVPKQPQTSGARGAAAAGSVSVTVQNQADAGSNNADRARLNKAVEKANSLTQSFNRYLNFSVDDSTKELVVKVIDNDTKEVVRQIPPKEMLTLMERFDRIQALLFSKNV